MRQSPEVLVTALSQGYPTGPRVLSEVHLRVEKGELVLIVGASGCGKSTLASCIKGIIPHLVDSDYEGSVMVGDSDVLATDPAVLAAAVGMVFQDPEAQLCNLYMQDEIAFGPENLKRSADDVWASVADAAALLGLPQEDMRTRLIYELSGGQKQRLATVSVMAMNPTVLVFDEPTANLDPQGGRDVAEIIRQMRDKGATQIVIGHRIDDLVDAADHIVVMRGGEVVADTSPRDLFERLGMEFCTQNGVWTPQIVELALKLRPYIAWDPLPLSTQEAADQLSAQPSVSRPVPMASMGAPIESVAAGVERSASDPEAGKTIIEVEDVHFSYDNGLEALRGVSFGIREGESVAIVGTNGSGKTTLAKVLVSLLRPQSGSATVCGMDVRRTPTRSITKKVGYVFQYPEHQFVKENVFDEVAYGPEVHGYLPDKIEERVEAILSLFGLTDFKDRHPLALSGGQKRRLSVATMLVLDPMVLILDEPTFGQDQDNTRRMMEYLLEDMRRDRADLLTTIMITHDMELVTEHCDRVLVMSHGRLIFNGAPRELMSRPEIMEEGDLCEVPVNALVGILHKMGIPVPTDLLGVDEFVEWYCNSSSQAAPVRSEH